MELKRFTITALPFPQSDAEAEFVEYALDEDDALEKFEKRYPAFRVKEVKAS
jgi:hypothetical protein